MKKPLVALAIAASVTLGTPALTHAAAPAKVVTKAEFKKATKDMPMTKVHKIFDTNGKQSSFYSGDPEYCNEVDDFGCPEQSRDYKGQGTYSSVSVWYVKGPDGVWRLDSKSAYWG